MSKVNYAGNIGFDTSFRRDKSNSVYGLWESKAETHKHHLFVGNAYPSTAQDRYAFLTL